jgi:hypothetical protein
VVICSGGYALLAGRNNGDNLISEDEPYRRLAAYSCCRRGAPLHCAGRRFHLSRYPRVGPFGQPVSVLTERRGKRSAASPLCRHEHQGEKPTTGGFISLGIGLSPGPYCRNGNAKFCCLFFLPALRNGLRSLARKPARYRQFYLPRLWNTGS